MILSKYPFGEKGIIDFGSITNSCIWADVTIKGEKVRIYNFHLQSNKVSKEADEIVENLQKNEDVKWYEDSKDILRKYKNTNISRTKQIQKIVSHIKDCPHPYIIGSDMNDAVSYTHLRAHETVLDLVCRLLLEKKKNKDKETKLNEPHKLKHDKSYIIDAPHSIYTSTDSKYILVTISR